MLGAQLHIGKTSIPHTSKCGAAPVAADPVLRERRFGALRHNRRPKETAADLVAGNDKEGEKEKVCGLLCIRSWKLITKDSKIHLNRLLRIRVSRSLALLSNQP